MYPKKLTEIKAIGDKEIGTIWLEKRGYVCAGERYDIEECASSKKKVKVIVTSLIDKIATDRGISFEDAQGLLSPKEIDGVVVDESGSILRAYPNEFADLEYWSALSNLSEAEQITTIFIRHRHAYPIEFSEQAAINDTHLNIITPDLEEEDMINLKDKSIIQVGNTQVVVSGNHAASVDEISVLPIAGSINSGDVGFLMAGRGKRYLLGLKNWTSQKTKTLHEGLVPLVYEFYQNEKLGWAKPEPVATTSEDEIEGELPQLTGTDSTGESSITELETVDLVAGSAS